MSLSNVIHFLTKEENEAALEEFFTRARCVNEQRRLAAIVAQDALTRLCKVMCDRSGQCYKVRALLFSLWNGKPASLIEVVNLDWELRTDLCSVILAFGFEDRQVKFFYDALRDAVQAAGQWDWFLEERLNMKLLADYVQAVKEGA